MNMSKRKSDVIKEIIQSDVKIKYDELADAMIKYTDDCKEKEIKYE